MNLTACNKDCDHASQASVILLTPRQTLDRVGWDGDPGSDDAATDTEGDRGAGGTGDAQPDGVHVGWLRGGCKAPCPHACPVSQPRYGSWRFGCACFDVFPTIFSLFFVSGGLVGVNISASKHSGTSLVDVAADITTAEETAHLVDGLKVRTWC